MRPLQVIIGILVAAVAILAVAMGFIIHQGREAVTSNRDVLCQLGAIISDEPTNSPRQGETHEHFVARIDDYNMFLHSLDTIDCARSGLSINERRRAEHRFHRRVERRGVVPSNPGGNPGGRPGPPDGGPSVDVCVKHPQLSVCAGVDLPPLPGGVR